MAEPKRAVFLLALTIWLASATYGLSAMWRYSSLPGQIGSAPTRWPTQSRIERRDKFTLLFFAHPLCPCTRASMTQLERLAAMCHERVDTHVLFISPGTTANDPAWQQSALHTAARRIPGVTIHTDVDRAESELFNVRTSGMCVLYDAAGLLVFRGGLTVARGHEGDSDGLDSLKALVLGGAPALPETNVYGCPLFEAPATCAVADKSTN